MTKRIAVALSAVLPLSSAEAFDGHEVAAGPLRMTVGRIADVTACGKPVPVPVVLVNRGEDALTVRLELFGLVDEWRAVGETGRTVTVPAGGRAEAAFAMAAGEGAESALYPAHVRATFTAGGGERTAHAVRIFACRFPPASGDARADPPVVDVPADAAIDLSHLSAHRCTWRRFDGEPQSAPHGWTGTDEATGTSLGVRNVARGAARRAFVLHPPWRGGAGAAFLCWTLRLPDAKPIKLRFANAIRDHSADEPPSDGVTFRAWVGEEKLFERHTAAKTWTPGEADLSRWAGEEIELRLESHPGPDRNTVCDSSYWAEPIVQAGTVAEALSAEERKALRDRARRVLAVGAGAGREELAFELDGPCRAAVALGRAGLADAAIAFGTAERSVVLDGLRVRVLDQPAGWKPSPLVVRWVGVTPGAAGEKITVTHRCVLDGEAFDLVCELWAEKSGLRIRTTCPKRITDLAPGPADVEAGRVFYGHGYCVVEPGAFVSRFGGHDLSTSHVACDFPGVSLLTASDNPPERFEVDPADRTYALHTTMGATLTFVPSLDGAFDAAFRYRPLYDKQAAPAFADKAGRFVFDIWGGRYADIARRMRRMIAYGLTDSLLTVHVWQRWGYDYRLPDIYPPNPDLGTVEEMREIGRVCRDANIPWGLHDNYIDVYPDSEGFTYENVCYTPGGEPVRAWYNRGRGAQSYRWRPDRFQPFLRRNIELIAEDLAPTHYFIDVFTSMGCVDFHDRQGRYHSSLETRKHWGEAFAHIRQRFGGDAPMTSEAGHDQLTGYLEGADCQFLRLSDRPGRFVRRVPCKAWQRVPWYDAVLHDRFSLHGVGYSRRYQGGRTRRHAGIESDDYISAELLTGHALMIDAGAFGRGAVRKYWLAQDVIRGIAAERITAVRFADGDIDRQTITWSDGTTIRVNRGEGDWRTAGRVLPPCGYFAGGEGGLISAIERIDGVIVEQSSGAGRRYANARGHDASAGVRIRPEAVGIEHLGDGRFRLRMRWHADQPAPRAARAFVHFVANLDTWRDERIAFQGDFDPDPPATKWAGVVEAAPTHPLSVPPDADDREYAVVAGLYDRTGRLPLAGKDVGSRRILLGTLHVSRAGGKVTDVRLQKAPTPPDRTQRWNLEARPIDFGWVRTTGALRCTPTDGGLLLTPLPDEPAFDLTVRPTEAGMDAAVGRIRAVKIDGTPGRDVPFNADGGAVTFRTKPGEFAYRLEPRGR